MKITIVFILIISHSLISLAQELVPNFIGIQSGVSFFNNNVLVLDNIRGEISNDNYYSSSANNLTSQANKFDNSLNMEFRLVRNKLGLFTGIKYSRIIYKLGEFEYWWQMPDYFYWLFKQQGTITQYLRVEEIKQTSNYLAIPIELKIYPFRHRFFTLFYMLGFEFDFKLNTKTDITFHDNNMEVHQKEVAAQISTPNHFNSLFYGSVGFKLGRDNNPSLSFQAYLPAAFLLQERNGIVNPEIGGGFQLGVQIPLNQINYE